MIVGFVNIFFVVQKKNSYFIKHHSYSVISNEKEIFPIKIIKPFEGHVLIAKNKNKYFLLNFIAKGINLKIVAEGVDKEWKFKKLKELGVDYFQGFYFSKPLPREDFEKWALNNLSKFGS